MSCFYGLLMMMTKNSTWLNQRFKNFNAFSGETQVSVVEGVTYISSRNGTNYNYSSDIITFTLPEALSW